MFWPDAEGDEIINNLQSCPFWGKIRTVHRNVLWNFIDLPRLETFHAALERNMRRQHYVGDGTVSY